MSYFGDQFCTLGELYLITCLSYHQVWHYTSTNHGQNQAPTCAEVAALATRPGLIPRSILYNRPPFSLGFIKGRGF